MFVLVTIYTSHMLARDECSSDSRTPQTATKNQTPSFSPFMGDEIAVTHNFETTAFHLSRHWHNTVMTVFFRNKKKTNKLCIETCSKIYLNPFDLIAIKPELFVVRKLVIFRSALRLVHFLWTRMTCQISDCVLSRLLYLITAKNTSSKPYKMQDSD